MEPSLPPSLRLKAQAVYLLIETVTLLKRRRRTDRRIETRKGPPLQDTGPERRDHLPREIEVRETKTTSTRLLLLGIEVVEMEKSQAILRKTSRNNLQPLKTQQRVIRLEVGTSLPLVTAPLELIDLQTDRLLLQGTGMMKRIGRSGEVD